jgi:hypothetical protein
MSKMCKKKWSKTYHVQICLNYGDFIMFPFLSIFSVPKKLAHIASIIWTRRVHVCIRDVVGGSEKLSLGSSLEACRLYTLVPFYATVL